MRSSDHNLSSEERIDTLVVLLNEERMAEEIDERIDLVVETFKTKVKVPLSHPDFNRLIAEFVRDLYRKGLRLPRYLSLKEALAEAVSLLEKYYQGIHTRGYDEALVDASGNDLEGFEYVLSQLAESIKAVERIKYVKWVFTDTVDQSDWEAHCRIAATYLVKYKDLLPPEFRDMDPARLAEHFQDLIINLL